ncbi:tetratricopeptide repeat protein [Streptomyces sp. NPDC050803]|uniref:AfsR/SARP family transcriptional regulator n=1 Tax=unclassified Streptomyces TaxID=2593676 RepID=UPI00343EF5B5
MGAGTDTGVRYTVLGPVEVSAVGAPVSRVEPRHRAVLAYLLLHAGTVIGTERLIGAMWGPSAPDSARAQIHASVAVVRRVLRGAGAADALQTRAGGYVIRPEPGQLDLAEFTRLSSTADATGLRSALGLWRGQALADVNGDYVAEARARLEERRLTVCERLADLDLAAGRHHELVDELAAQVAAHPLRERATVQLMLALHRSGRQADALGAARTFRTLLADRQGLDPGRAFTALETGILRDDPALHLANSAPGPAAPPKDPQPAPRGMSFLPFDLPDFAGRADELERLVTERPDDGATVTISAVSGMAGIGKTALAVRVAHRLAGHYPDGQLFVDLRAHTAGQEPLTAEAALEMLLRQLGVPAERVPASLSDRAALWRAELAGRKALIVLDNAADAAQVRPLLPSPSPSLVLITSRRRLVDLDGARALSMDVLPVEDALALFRTIVGERAAAEPDAALDVVRLCGLLPLAVRIAGARLHHRPRWTVAYLAERLADQSRRLSELATADRGVAAAFALSYGQLDAEQRRMFRLLGLHPGTDLDAYAAAALADLPLDRAETVLEDLLDAHVLAQHVPGRYTFHDLLREHARTTAGAEETEESRYEAVTRLLDHLLHTTCVAMDLLFPEGRKRRPQPPPSPTPAVPLATAARATAWVESERTNLIAAGVHAADAGRPAYTGHLAAALNHYLDVHAHHQDARTLHAQAVQACRRAGDRSGEARALTDLGRLKSHEGRYAEALDDFERALDLYRATGERAGEARVLNHLGDLHRRQGRSRQADQHYRSALPLFRALGVRVGEAASLSRIGMVLEQEGRYEESLDHLRQALRLYRDLGYHRGTATALDHLGVVHRRLGRHDEALDHHRQALRVHHEHGYRGYDFETHNGLGEAAQALGEPALAVDSHTTALTLATEVGNRPEQARAAHGLARAHHALGNPDKARHHARQALTQYAELGMPAADELHQILEDLA